MKFIRLYIPLLLFIMMGAWSCTNSDVEETFIVTRSDFKKSIVETGELESLNSYIINMRQYGSRWYRYKIVGMVDHGSVLQVGDSIIQIDASQIEKYIIDQEDAYEKQQASLNKLRVQQEINRGEQKANYDNELAAYTLKKLELESYSFESELKQKIKSLEFKQSEIRLEKCKRQMELNDVVERNSLKIENIRLKQIKERIEEHRAVLPEMTIRTPIPGIFQANWNRRSRNFVQIGDELFIGRGIAKVPDLEWMKVTTTVNETDISKIKLNQKVVVRLDALPEVAFEAEVMKVASLCHSDYNNSKKKVFDVEIRCLSSDLRLKPGMTVSCEFMLNEYTDALVVPRTMIHAEDDELFIFKKQKFSSTKLPIKLLASNDQFAVVEGSLEEGDQLLIINENISTQTK